MKHSIWLLVCWAIGASSAAAQNALPPADPPYFRVQYEPSNEPGELSFGVSYTIWIPPEVETLRGVIVHQHGCGEGACKGGRTAAYDWHWQALAREHRCALLGPSYEQPEGADCHLWCDPRNGSEAKFLQALDDLACQTDHPEIASVPWALWGHSGGGVWAGTMLMLHPQRSAAVWLRSGTPKMQAEPDSDLPSMDVPEAALAVPVMCNLGTKEGVTVTDGRFSGVWKKNRSFFSDIRGQGGRIGVAVDPHSSHDCGNSRYLAIPWFDACLADRLSETGGSELQPIKIENAWLAPLLSANAVPVSRFEGDRDTSVWLPNQRVARAYSEYITDGKVSDSTPPPRPSNVKLEGTTLRWDATADLQSGIGWFSIQRDGEEIARVPEKLPGNVGRTVFQQTSYHDTPTPPLAEMRLELDRIEQHPEQEQRRERDQGTEREQASARSPNTQQGENTDQNIAEKYTIRTVNSVGLKSPPETPNVVQIMADDLGWGAVGYNGQAFVKTPHLDALARGGMVFRHAHAAPVCSPTRASLQVGFHAGHTWTDWNIRWPAKGFRQRSVTIGKSLQRAGYVTGAFGKWGFGGSAGQGGVLRSNPEIDNPETVPTNQGYDTFYGCLDHVRAHTFFMDSLWQSKRGAPQGLELTPTGNTAENRFHRYCDDLYAEHAGRFLSEHAGKAPPFYLQLHFQIPHAPLNQITELEGWFDTYAETDTSDWPAAAKQYAAMVTRMDQHIGRLMKQLRDPNGDGDCSDSVVNETLVVFTSDNGGYRGAAFVEQFELNGRLRGGKGSLYEGGIRVPMLAYWPGTIPAGSESDRPVCVTDLLPTFAELAGTRAPAGVDGVSLAPTLTGRGYQRPREFLAFEARDDWAIIRDSMKLIYHDRGKGRYELYDLQVDSAEQHDLLKVKDEDASERYAALKSQLTNHGQTAGVVYGSAAHRAEARTKGKQADEPHYVSFPQWNGGDGAGLADLQHWDFEDQPTPRAMWVATVGHRGRGQSMATLSSKLRLLGIEVGGGEGRQTVRLSPEAKLHGINEVRVTDGGRLRLAGGTVGSDRWVDVLPGGKLVGRGNIQATLHSAGRLSASGPLVIAGDYRPTDSAVTLLTAGPNTKAAPLTVKKGSVHAAGRLVVRLEQSYEPKPGNVIRLIDAPTITGRFDEVTLPELPRGTEWDRSKFYQSGTIAVR